MAFGPGRPPITEDVAEVIAKDIKSTEDRSMASEVPVSFQKPMMARPSLKAWPTRPQSIAICAALVALVALIGFWLAA